MQTSFESLVKCGKNPKTKEITLHTSSKAPSFARGVNSARSELVRVPARAACYRRRGLATWAPNPAQPLADQPINLLNPVNPMNLHPLAKELKRKGHQRR